MATICIVGLWHQGSVLSACLADLGHQVRGVGEERSVAWLSAARPVAHLYRPLGPPIITHDVRTAEMAKHASNAYLAASISFINEIADLCDEAGADVVDVARIMRLDRRIGKDAFLSAGLGFAG